jgi:ribosomal RNA-processing protein 8
MKLSLQQPPEEPTESNEQKRRRVKSELEVLHQRYKSMTSENLHTEFQEHPETWHHYHAIAEINESSFPVESIPRNCVIQALTQVKTKRVKRVVDMGCGMAHIAKHFEGDPRFHFTNLDHVSCDPERVTVADIRRLPLEDDSVEICILSLAMWGAHCEDYLSEAYRVLETHGGLLYLVEPTKRWTTDDDPTNPANRLIALVQQHGFNILERKIEKFCFLVCQREF